MDMDEERPAAVEETNSEEDTEPQGAGSGDTAATTVEIVQNEAAFAALEASGDEATGAADTVEAGAGKDDGEATGAEAEAGSEEGAGEATGAEADGAEAGAEEGAGEATGTEADSAQSGAEVNAGEATGAEADAAQPGTEEGAGEATGAEVDAAQTGAEEDVGEATGAETDAAEAGSEEEGEAEAEAEAGEANNADGDATGDDEAAADGSNSVAAAAEEGAEENHVAPDEGGDAEAEGGAEEEGAEVGNEEEGEAAEAAGHGEEAVEDYGEEVVEGRGEEEEECGEDDDDDDDDDVVDDADADADADDEPFQEQVPEYTQQQQHQDAPQYAEQHQQQQQRQADSVGNKTDLVTKRYMRLLQAGKLASKKKEEQLIKVAASKSTSSNWREHITSPTVYKAEMARMHEKNANIEPWLKPVARRAGSLSPMDPGQTRRASSSPDPTLRMQRTVSEPPFRYNTSPMKKLIAPGPGAYQPVADRYGRNEGVGIGFGKAKQRPQQSPCVTENVVSPGPIYVPCLSAVSNQTSLPLISFPRKDMGTRFNLSASMPSNCPHWNPGPGDYMPSLVAAGGSAAVGGDGAPSWMFTKTIKGIAPNSNLSATAFVSREHAATDNFGVHSPGPALYSPNPVKSSNKIGAPCYSIGAKAASFIDGYFDPLRQTSPGPIYEPASMDKRGQRTFGYNAHATFGKANKTWSPEKNLSGSAFISYEHATLANQALHSPGPVYMPSVDTKTSRVKGTALFSGQQDRFYSRFEPGRAV